MNSVFQVLNAGYSVLVGIWCLFLLTGLKRETPVSFRVGMFLSGVSFMTHGFLSLLGVLGNAWATPEVIASSFVPCLVSAIFAWVSSRRTKRDTHGKVD